MDTYRTAWDDGYGGDVSDAADDDFISDAPPSAIGQDERRMQVRAYNYWAALLGERSFPKITEYAIADHPDFADNSVLLDFAQSIDNPRIAYLGTALAAECPDATGIAHLTDVPRSSLLSRITDHYLQIIANEAPIGFEAEFTGLTGTTLLYRGILLPFSDDGERISQILGVINWKQLADQAMTDQLLAEIDTALVSGSAATTAPATHAAARYDAWADGPRIGTPPGEGDAEDTILDLGWHPELPAGAIDLPAPQFSEQVAPGVGAGDAPATLAELLSHARHSALQAATAEDRSHAALYAAIGRAWDFALAAAVAPQDYAALLAEAGLAVQDRAPYTPQLKLVFGAQYDKTRLAEYAAVLAHAARHALNQGTLAGHLATAPGGLKGVVQAERAARRGTPEIRPAATTPATLARKLRRMAPVSLDALPHEGAEFTLVLARRGAAGCELLGEASADPRLVARLARGLLARS